MANKASSIALVGSVARGEDTAESDCDFLVTFEVGASLFDQAHLALDIEELLGGDVDVISTGSLEPRHADMLADAIRL